MSKYTHIVNIVEDRIAHGDYAARKFPTEGELAIETGVSRITARRAVNYLVSKGVLLRQDNGRVAVNNQQSGNRKLYLALLQPSYLSPSADPYVDLWRTGMERAAAQYGATLRAILYSHWHDTVIQDTLEGFDGVFFIPRATAIPTWMLDLFGKHSPRVIALGRDLSEWGIQSVRMSQPASIQRLLDHLAGLGHTRIDCFNIMPVVAVIESRIEQWRVWRAAHGMSGNLLNFEGGPSTRGLSDALRLACEMMGNLLDSGQITSSAVYCTTTPSALGAMRAMADRGIAVGRDISVCAASDEGIGQYLRPSLTSLTMHDPSPYLSLCIQRIISGGKGWSGPLLIQPNEMGLFTGESTGPCGNTEQIAAQA